MAPAVSQNAWLDWTPLPAGVIEKGRFVYVNDALLALLGYSREAMIGMDFFYPVIEEDRARVRDRHMRRVRGEAVTSSYEFDVERIDGQRRRTEIWVTQIGETTVFQLHDRTDRAAHSRKLLALAQLGAVVQGEHVREGVLARIGDGVEALGCTMLGLEPDGEHLRIVSQHTSAALRAKLDSVFGRQLIGLSIPRTPGSKIAWDEGIAYIDDAPVDAARFWGEIGTAVREIALEHGLLRAVLLRIDESGAPSRLLLLAASWFEREDLPALSLFGTQITAALEAARLINDLRRSYQDLGRAQDQLVQRERLAALGEMAAAVAHEVRNPLGVIFNSLGSLRRLIAGDGDARVLFDILSEEARRLNDIVGELLDFARPAKLSLQPTNLADVVDEAIDAALAGADARITIERVRRPMPTVRVDARLLRQAVLNVALNAVQSIEREGAIATRVESVERDGARFARIEIADTGPGIPADVIARIFEPFFTTRAKGTGIGLAVVKRIVEEHSGRLAVNSEPGRGTTFAIELPLD